MALRSFWVLKKQHARERVCCSYLDESQQNLCLRLHPEDLASEEGEEAWPEALLSFALKETARDARCHELLQEVQIRQFRYSGRETWKQLVWSIRWRGIQGRPGRGCLASTREASSRQRCDSKRQTFVVAKASHRGGSWPNDDQFGPPEKASGGCSERYVVGALERETCAHGTTTL